jgi:hypothetical protein
MIVPAVGCTQLTVGGVVSSVDLASRCWADAGEVETADSVSVTTATTGRNER